jgi:hypothetical protein
VQAFALVGGLHHDQREAHQRRRGLPNQDSRRLLCHSRFLPINAKHLTLMAPRVGSLLQPIALVSAMMV